MITRPVQLSGRWRALRPECRTRITHIPCNQRNTARCTKNRRRSHSTRQRFIRRGGLRGSVQRHSGRLVANGLTRIEEPPTTRQLEDARLSPPPPVLPMLPHLARIRSRNMGTTSFLSWNSTGLVHARETQRLDVDIDRFSTELRAGCSGLRRHGGSFGPAIQHVVVRER